MSSRRGLRFWKTKRPITLDEFGGTADGALVIVVEGDQRFHITPPRVANALRFMLARVQGPNSTFPARLAVTSALRGEGVSFMTRSLASVLAYDTNDSVVVVDLNWHDQAGPRKSRRRSKPDGGVSSKVSPKSTAGSDAAEQPDVDDDDELIDDTAVDDQEATSSPPERNVPDGSPESSSQGATPSVPGVGTLADAVERGVDIEDILQPTSNRRLSLISAGVVARPRRPAMAGSAALEAAIDKIAGRFDHVLLDLPPVLASSDAITLSQLAEAFVLVVQQGATATTQVEAALDELSGGVNLGVVLNRFDSAIPRPLRRMVGV